MSQNPTYTGFAGNELIASGELTSLLTAAKSRHDLARAEQLLIFEDATGRQVDFDLSGTIDDVLRRETGQPQVRGPGRPRLGVVAREVTLLPRHWDWLAEQPRGASATLRRLVDEARKNESPRDAARRTAAAAGRVMTVLAGNLPNFEEAYRALDAGDRDRFSELIADWPHDVRLHLLRQAELSFSARDA